MPAANEEYLTAVFRHWPLACMQFVSEHFAENRSNLWRTVTKLWCVNFNFFLEHPVIVETSKQSQFTHSTLSSIKHHMLI